MKWNELYQYFVRLKNWDRVTGWLHFGLMVSISLQVISGFFIYKDSEPFNEISKQIHRYSGYLAGVLLLVHWIRSFYKRDMMRHLYPWNRGGVRRILGDIKGLLKEKKMPQKGMSIGLPGFVEGVGILLATLLAITGIPLPTLKYIYQTDTPFMKVLHQTHVYVTFLFIAFWVGHGSMAVVNYFMQKK